MHTGCLDTFDCTGVVGIDGTAPTFGVPTHGGVLGAVCILGVFSFVAFGLVVISSTSK
jgi:hypothetical protein